MVQTSKHRQSDNLALLWGFNVARFGTILFECSKRAMPVKIIEVIGQYPVQVLSMEHEHMVQALASDGADQPFDQRILPGATSGNKLLLQTQREGSRLKLQAINTITVPKQVGGGWE